MTKSALESFFDGYVWQLVAVKGTCTVQRLDEGPLRKPEAEVAAAWPADAYCVVESEAGFKRLQLTDCLWNAQGRILISPRLKESLCGFGVPDVDYLPLRVIDRTGKTLALDYALVHFRNSPDCLDLEASGAKRSRVLPRKAESLERLVFKSHPGKPLFHPETYNKVTLLSGPLAERLADEGYTGMRFMGLFDFGAKGDLPPHPERRAVDALCTRLWQNAQRRLAPGVQET
jgi:hypothetical protein